MVRKSNTQRFAAIAFVAASIVTFFAPLDSPAQSKPKLLPPGRCTKERHRELQDEVDKTKALVRGCSSPPDSIEVMMEKEQWFRDAIIARVVINFECFENGDDGHKQQVRDLGEGMAYCQDRIEAKRKHQARCR